MEMGEVRRAGRVVCAGTPGRKKAEAGRSSGPPSRTDKLALSREAVARLEEHNRQMMEEARKREKDTSGGSGTLDLLEKGLKAMNKCQKIYARVASGDKVPPEDLRYLERNDPEGYKLALAMRRPKKNPKEWKSVLDDEDRAALRGGDAGEAAPEPES